MTKDYITCAAHRLNVTVPPVVNLHAKVEISCSNHSRDMEGSQNFKSMSRDPFPTPFDLIFPLLSLVPPVDNLHAKFEVSSSNRSRGIEGVPTFQK